MTSLYQMMKLPRVGIAYLIVGLESMWIINIYMLLFRQIE